MDRSTPASRGTVVDAACQLFADRGYRGTSMKDIAGTLGVRAPSLYNHVSSKQEILFAIMDKAMDRALSALEEALAGVEDVSEQLRRATESLVLDFLRFPAEVTVCNTEVRSLEAANRLAIVAKRDQYAATVRRIIEQGCRNGRFSTRTPQIAAFAVLEMGNSAKSWFRPSGRYPDTFVASEYGEFALRVVGAGTRPVRPLRRAPVAPGHQGHLLATGIADPPGEARFRSRLAGPQPAGLRRTGRGRR